MSLSLCLCWLVQSQTSSLVSSGLAEWDLDKDAALLDFRDLEGACAVKNFPLVPFSDQYPCGCVCGVCRGDGDPLCRVQQWRRCCGCDIRVAFETLPWKTSSAPRVPWRSAVGGSSAAHDGCVLATPNHHSLPATRLLFPNLFLSLSLSHAHSIFAPMCL